MPAQLERIAAPGRTRTVAEGEVLIRAGEGTAPFCIAAVQQVLTE